MTNERLQAKDLSQIGLPDVFRPIVVGYTIGLTVLFWCSGLLVLVNIFVSSGELVAFNEETSIWAFLAAILFGLPLVAMLQGVLLALLCGLGLAVYRRVF